MTIEIKPLTREFRFGSLKLPDPNPDMTVEQVRDTYVGTYPELSTAAIEGPETRSETLLYTFRRAIGTKG